MGLICYVEFAEPLGHFITLSGVRRDAELVFSPLWNDFVQGLIKWLQRKSLKSYLLNVTTDLGLSLMYRFMGQHRMRKQLLNRRMQHQREWKSSCTVSGILKWSWLRWLREWRALMLFLLWKSQQLFKVPAECSAERVLIVCQWKEEGTLGSWCRPLSLIHQKKCSSPNFCGNTYLEDWIVYPWPKASVRERNLIW